MANKNSALMRKVSTLVFLAKLKKPVIRKVVFLKKMRKLKMVEQHLHSYYGDLKEYEFSSSRMRMKKLYTKLLLSCRCFGYGKTDMYRFSEESAVELYEYDSIDERAERFIHSFYQQMRNESTF